MTEDNLPAVRQPDPPAVTDVDSWATVMRPVIALSERIVGTEFVPASMRNSVPAVTAAILYGREVGLPPMTALTQTHVIEGKPSISAEGMRAMILAAGHDLVFDETTGATCRMRARRRGSEHWTELAWSIDMARAAGLTGKNNWKHYPRAMLIARCTGDLARMVFPDVIHGFRSVEEMQDLGGEDAAVPSGEAPASGGTKVSRRRTAKKTAAALPAPAAPPADASGPPLPGEPGYDDSPAGHADAAQDAAEAPTTVPGRGVPETAGEGADTAAVARDTDPGEGSAPSPVPDGGPEEEEIPRPRVHPQTGEPGAATGSAEVGASGAPGSPEHEHPAGPRKLSRAQHRMLMGQFGGFGMADDREERLLATTTIVGREIESSNDLTHHEATTLIDTLAKIKDRMGLNRLLDEYDAAKAAQAEQDEADEAAKGEES